MDAMIDIQPRELYGTNFKYFNGTSALQITNNIPDAAGETALLLSYHNGTALVLAPVVASAVGATVPGYRTLLLPA